MRTMKGILKLKLKKIMDLPPEKFYYEFVHILDGVPEPSPDARMLLQMWAAILVEIEEGRFEINREKLIQDLLKEVP